MFTKTESYLQVLPIELIHRIFDHLDAETIIFSIRRVSKRFYTIANTCNRYQLDFRYAFKYDLNIIARIVDLKNVISLTLSDEDEASEQISLFLAHFHIDQFIRLRSLNLINIKTEDLKALQEHVMKCPLRTLSVVFQWEYEDTRAALLSSIMSQNELLKFEFDGDREIFNEIQWSTQCRLKHLTVDQLLWNEVYSSLGHLPSLRTLVVKNVNRAFFNKDITRDSVIPQSNHLTPISLCCGDDNITMDNLESFLSLVPRLAHIRLTTDDCSINSSTVDGSQWEELIQLKLPMLTKFEFSFYTQFFDFKDSRIVESMITKFRISFWVEMKKWLIKCDWRPLKDFNSI
ncbi:unnamed protein product [Rotaria magnacalcarata]|uniref:F-box domain-containing protein n=1 Tax=Rotaria magnacalcarata TaxID=392030 RepID=A0A820CJJ4_9BILA|nr:unnamed protein product [Rotaria magnacalcarata]CAF4223306.1 unnamed protein product [Rotaria magnacalcarata]